MTKTCFLLLCCLAFLSACRREAPSSAQAPAPSPPVSRKAWHCPMHPQIVREAPGTCPLCGMELVPFEADASAIASQSQISVGPEVSVAPSLLQKIGVHTSPARPGKLGRELRLDAEGVLDERSLTSITVRAMGYLEDVPAPRTGEAVHAGEVLAYLYSPDLAAAQGEWLAALARHDTLATRIAQERLAALGVTGAVLEEAKRLGKAVRSIPLRSPASGWLASRNATPGQSLMAGSEVFRIARGNGALLEAHLPQGDLQGVRAGMVADLSGPGFSEGHARVTAILPALDRTSRTATVRLAAPSIRPGALYQVTLHPGAEEGLLVPEEAVLHSGRRDVVLLALRNGRFRPVEVTTGSTAQGKTLIRHGLSEGDEVVDATQFLLDGESRLQTALAAMGEGKATP